MSGKVVNVMKDFKICDCFFKLMSELFLGERLTTHMKYFNRECELDSR